MRIAVRIALAVLSGVLAVVYYQEELWFIASIWLLSCIVWMIGAYVAIRIIKLRKEIGSDRG